MNVANVGQGASNYDPSWIYGNSPLSSLMSQMQTGVSGNSPSTTAGNMGNFAGGIDPSVLQALGWTGGNPFVDTGATGNPESGAYTPGGFQLSPQFQQFLQQQGITPMTTAGAGNSNNLQFFGQDGQQIGATQNKALPSDMDVYMAGALGLGAFGAYGALNGVGSAASGANVASGGGLAGTDLPAYPGAYTGAGSASGAPLASAGNDFSGMGSALSANGADGAAPAAGDWFAGAGGTGLSASDAGLGASGALDAAGGTAAGGGIGSTLGGIASWAKANPTLVGAGGSLINGLLGYSAATNAAGVQANAANNAAAASLAQYQQTRADQAPWRAAGAQALGQLGDLMGTSGNTGAANYGMLAHNFDASDLQTNLAPNYQFMLNQGLGATTNAGNAAGFSGNTLQGINNYAQGYASNAYQQAFNNYTANQTSQYNRLSNLAGLGQTANQSTDTLGQQSTSNANNYSTSGAASTAAGIVGGTNAATNAVNNISGWNYLAGSGYSDERLKTDIHQIGETKGGVPLYTYRYKVGGPTQVGVMAQELEKVAPEAVSKDAQGFRKVKYHLLKDL